MKTTHRYLSTTKKRHGFTLIELMVVITILAALMGLLIPAVQAVRMRGHNVRCINRLAGLGKAIQSYGLSHNGKLPLLHDGTTNGSWVRQLLPYLEQKPLDELLGTTVSAGGSNMYVEVLVCPLDSNNDGVSGGLSYVANAGYIASTQVNSVTPYTDPTAHDPDNYIDADSWGEDACLDAGVFHRKSGTRRMTLSRISNRDGATYTILCSENVNAGVGAGENFGSNVMQAIAFGAKCDMTIANWDGSGWAGNTTLLPSDTTNLSGILPASKLNSEEAGSQLSPHSNHPGIVNVLFCAGNAKSLNDSMDLWTYAQLLTSGGAKKRGQPALTSEY